MKRHGRIDRALILARRHGPTAPVWRKRAAILSGAVEAHYAWLESSLGKSKLSQLYTLLDELIALEQPE